MSISLLERLVVVAVIGMATSGCGGASGGDERGAPPEQATIIDLVAVLPSAEAFVSPGAATSLPTPEPTSLPTPEPSATIEPPDRSDVGPRRITVSFTGDNLAHSPIVTQAWHNGADAAYDFRPIFARVAPILAEADVAVCHLETPVAPTGEALSTAPLYGVPGEIAAGLASAGYDRCSTASNHSLDRGAAGIDATVAALESAGLQQTGMSRSPLDTIVPVVTVAGVAVAHLSYAFGFNGRSLPAEEPWRANLIDPFRIVADSADARSRGAEVVIVSLHWGVEGSAVPSSYQREIANEITASGTVDLIVGHHAHVLQPIESVNDRWVVYGMGNFLSNMPTGDRWPASSQDGAIVTVDIEEQPDGSMAVLQPVVVPTWVDRSGGFVIRPVVDDLADPAVSAGVKAELARSLDRTTAVLGPFLAPTATPDPYIEPG